MRPLWFYYRNLKKKLFCLTQSFQSPQQQAYSIACFSVGKQRIGNGLSFIFFLFQMVVVMLTEAGRELDNESCRCGIVEFLFKIPFAAA